jgi:hypothetical protein
VELYLFFGTLVKELIISLKLIPDQNGEVTLHERFWHFQWKSLSAPPLIIAADLLGSTDQRLKTIGKNLLREL